MYIIGLPTVELSSVIFQSGFVVLGNKFQQAIKNFTRSGKQYDVKFLYKLVQCFLIKLPHLSFSMDVIIYERIKVERAVFVLLGLKHCGVRIIAAPNRVDCSRCCSS